MREFGIAFLSPLVPAAKRRAPMWPADPMARVLIESVVDTRVKASYKASPGRTYKETWMEFHTVLTHTAGL